MALPCDTAPKPRTPPIKLAASLVLTGEMIDIEAGTTIRDLYDAARLLAQRLSLKGDAAYAAEVLLAAGIEPTPLVSREASGRDET